MANNARSFKAPQCEKPANVIEDDCPKFSLQQNPSGSGCGAARAATIIGIQAKQASMHSPIVAIAPREPRRHELDKFRERVAADETECVLGG
jgi:hypothetical protein